MRARQELGGDAWEVEVGGEWRGFPVPGQWHTGGLPHHEGQATHRLKFRAQEHAGIPHLAFGGVDYACEVRLNGTRVGAHAGYFQPFSFPVGGVLRRGENVLEVVVASPREESGPVWPLRKQLVKGIFNHHDCRPGAWHPEEGQSGNTGGIWGGVALEWRPAAHVVAIRTDVHLRDEDATVVVTLTTAGAPTTAKVTVLDPEGATVAEASGRESTLGVRIPHPRRWWPWDLGDQPIYTLRVKVGTDVVERPLAFCTVDQKEEAWHVNGRRVFLRGTNIIPAQYLSTYTADQAWQDVAMMVAAGLNVVRVHAHVTHPAFYEACDRAGLMVWQDFALQWSYDDGPAFAAEACRQIREMVAQLRHHACIALWCCHNEPVGQEHTLDPLLVQAARSEDPARVIRSHSDFAEHPYHGWYYGKRASYETRPGGPLVTEFGAQALPDVETLKAILPADALWPPVWERWAYHDFQYEQQVWIAGVEPGDTLEGFVARSQAYQAELLADALDHYRRGRFAPITGVFQFMFVDGWPAITWSVVDHLRKPKAGYHALARAMSPVYASLRLPGDRLRAGTPVPLDLTVVNDLARAVPVVVEARLVGADGAARAMAPPLAVTLPADGLVDLSKQLKLETRTDWRGTCTLEVEVREGERLWSRAARPVVLDAWPAGLDGYKPVEMI